MKICLKSLTFVRLFLTHEKHQKDVLKVGTTTTTAMPTFLNFQPSNVKEVTSDGDQSVLPTLVFLSKQKFLLVNSQKFVHVQNHAAFSWCKLATLKRG